jgi:uncharacterized protein
MGIEDYAVGDLLWVGFGIFLLGMSKGGFPIGSVALPLLILIWPDQTAAARQAVAFMLPLLCAMDVVALILYRRHVDWSRLRPLAVGALLGVALGSVLFVSDEKALLALSERALKLTIGGIGLLFVGYQGARRWILRHLETAHPGRLASAAFGVAAGVTSTLAHAAGPVMQMYLLPQHLPKIRFAATTVAFFFVLNLVKVVPFALAGRFETGGLLIGLTMLPIIPLGVAAGFGLVRVTRQQHYTALIYLALAVASAGLIVKALAA